MRLTSSALLAGALLCSSPAFAVSKDMVQLQTQIQQLQDAVARLQQSNDERMGVMKDLIQQSADSVNKMAISVESLQKQMQAQHEAQSTKSDQVSGQIQSLNDSVDEIKARLATLQKLMQDVQGQQQSMSANMQNAPASGGSSSPAPATPAADTPTTGPAPVVRKGKPSANVPLAAEPASPAVPPADDLYKTALGDYMAAKYASRTTPTTRSPETPTTTRRRSTTVTAAIRQQSSPTTAFFSSTPTATKSPSLTFIKEWR
jgi:uncharacterized phage infection (PIP) family protein YhgE